jgi:hypothetical protein
VAKIPQASAVFSVFLGSILRFIPGLYPHGTFELPMFFPILMVFGFVGIAAWFLFNFFAVRAAANSLQSPGGTT